MTVYTNDTAMMSPSVPCSCICISIRARSLEQASFVSITGSGFAKKTALP
jgi:hypothetical protein